MYKATQILVMIAFVVIAFSACVGERDVRRALANADKLMEGHPDSALLLISTIDTANDLRDDELRALYYLLLTQAQYKCFSPTPLEDSLEFSLAYFRQSGNDEKTARACYYRAMTLYDHGRYNDAIPLLKEGVLLAEKLGDDELISKFYDTMGDINGEAGDYWQMLKYKKMFLAHSVKMQNIDYIVWSNIDVGLAFHKLGMNDSSDYYYTKAIPFLDKAGKYAYVLANIGNMYLRHNDLQTAEKYLLRSLDLEMKANTIAALSDLYMREGRLEDAAKLRAKVMSSQDADLKITMMSRYAENLLAGGDVKGAGEIYRWLFKLTDSLRAKNKENVIVELQKKYDYTKAEYEKQKSERESYMYLSIALLAIIVLIMVVYLYRRSKFRLHKVIETNKEEYETVIAEKMLHISVIESQVKQLGSDKAANEREISELHKEIREMLEVAYMRLGRGRRIYEDLKSGGRPVINSTDDRSCLIEYFSICEYKKYYRLLYEYGALPLGLKTCAVLYSMGISDDDMASVLDVSGQTVRSNKSKLKNLKKRHAPKGAIKKNIEENTA